MKVIGVWALLTSVVAGCGPLSNNRPSEVMADLVIVATADHVLVGRTLPLRAMARYANGNRESITAVWTSTHPETAQVEATGIVKGIRPGVATVVAAAGDRRAELALQVLPDYAGIWKGDIKIQSCHRISGWGTNPCRFYQGLRFLLELSLAQQRQSVTGNYSSQAGDVGTVRGEIQSDSLVLQGELVVPAARERNQPKIVQWSTTIDEQGHSMLGRFVIERRFWNVFGEQLVREEIEFVSVTREG